MKGNSGMRKAGGGIGSRVNVTVPVRVGNRSRNVSPAGASQIGESLGNHSTGDGGKKGGAAEATYKGMAPAGKPGGVPLGNAVALNVGGGGVGSGRKLYGQSGSNQTYGAPAAGLGRIANTKGQWPDTKR